MDNEYLDSQIYQINMLPTMCMLKGNPIPYNSIGAIIPDFFIDIPEVTNTVIANAYYTNFRQIKDYFEQNYEIHDIVTKSFHDSIM